MEFISLDVETANPNYSSICQIGMAAFKNDEVIYEYSTLVDPEEPFFAFNTFLHGITAEDVKGEPTFKQLHKTFTENLTGVPVLHYTAFDRAAFHRACEKCDLPDVGANWLDIAKVVRRTWDDVAYRGYGLSKMAKRLGIEYQEHDALEDAVAAGKVFLAAAQEAGIDNLEGWFDRIRAPLSGTSYTMKLEGNPDGEYYGENLVFTGELSMPRNQAKKLAANVGFTVQNAVNKHTTVLCIGTQDLGKLAGYEKSSKQRKAEEYNQSKGLHIRLISEEDIFRMINEAEN